MIEKIRFAMRHRNAGAHNWIIYRSMVSELMLRRDFFFGTVYDLGCGEAPYKKMIEDFGCSYVGVDWAESIHERKCDLMADLNKALPIDSCSVDALLSISVIEHLHNPELFLKECYRILKPGSHCFIQVPFMWGEHEAPNDYIRFTKYYFFLKLRELGFKDIEVKEQFKFWTTTALKINYQLKRLERGPKLFRILIRGILYIPFFFGLALAEFLDKIWNSKGEASGYFVTAKK